MLTVVSSAGAMLSLLKSLYFSQRSGFSKGPSERPISAAKMAFTESKCIECDACIDVCPTHCLTIAPDPGEDEKVLRQQLTAPAVNPKQALYVSGTLPQTRRLMVKDEDVCVHCGLCAERCPTAAWDMQKFELQLPYAGKPVNTLTKNT